MNILYKIIQLKSGLKTIHEFVILDKLFCTNLKFIHLNLKQYLCIMNSRKRKISRTDFLKTSGTVVGGVVALSNYGCLANINSLKELIIQGKTNYSLVLPTNSNEKEKKSGTSITILFI